MVDPLSGQILHRRDRPPPRSPETISVNSPRSNKADSFAAGATRKLSSSKSTFDPTLLNSNLQELDEAVAKLAANSIQLAALPQKQQSRRQRSVGAAGSIHNNDTGSQFSEFDNVQFQHDTTKYVIDNMERIAVGVAFPSLSKSGSRRSRSSRSSRRKRGLSLERLVSETILKEQGQHFSTEEDDDDDVHSSCTTTTSIFDILKDLRQMNQVIASETGTIVGSVNGGTVRNYNQSQHSPPTPPPQALEPATIVQPSDKLATTDTTDDRKPTTCKHVHTTNLLPRIDTEDEEPSLLPTEEWTPDWDAAEQLEPPASATAYRPLAYPPSANKSGCTDDTDPETINNSVNEKSFQSCVTQKSFFCDEQIAFAEWPAEDNCPVAVAVADEWTPFETTNFFSKTDHPVNGEVSAITTTDSFFGPLSLDSPSSMVQRDAQRQPTSRLLASLCDDELGPWLGNQASL